MASRTPTFTGEIHPFADRFPMLEGDELKALAEDIAEHGQLHPILLDKDGVLLDGRNRLSACDIAGVEPKFAVHVGDPVAVIVTANTHRRNLSAGQVAMARARALVEQGKRRNGRWAHGQTPSRDGVSSESMTKAGVILDHRPDFADAVMLGMMTLQAAYDEVNSGRKALDLSERRINILRVDAPDLSRMVAEEALSLDEAFAAYEKRTEDARRQREEREAADTRRWTQTADAVITIASISSPDWMDGFDDREDLRKDPQFRDAWKASYLEQARSKIDQLIEWSAHRGSTK